MRAEVPLETGEAGLVVGEEEEVRAEVPLEPGEAGLVVREEEEVRAEVPLKPGEAHHVGLLPPGLSARCQRIACNNNMSRCMPKSLAKGTFDLGGH